MASTEDWILWSERFAFSQYSANRQLSIEVAMGCCRHYRDARGMSTDPSLANADHYWLARLFGFLSQTPHGLSRYVNEGRGTTSVAIGDMLAILGWSVGSVPVIAMTVAWDAAKASGALDRVMAARDDVYRRLGWPVVPAPPASRPGPEQTAWAVAGYGHAGLFDLPFARDARPWFRMEELTEMIVVPPPPNA